MLGQPVHKVSGVSSTICYKCKRELEKFEKYIQVLEVELKQFRELYRQTMEQFETRGIEVKRCQKFTPSPTTANNTKGKRVCSMPSPLRPSNSKNIHPASKRQINLNLPADSDVQKNIFGHLAVHDDLVVATTPASRTEVFFCQCLCFCLFVFKEIILGILLKLNFIFQVNIQYPSKTVHKVIHDEWRAKVIRQVVAKEDEMAVRNILEQKELEESFLQRVEKASRKSAKTSVDESGPRS